MNAREYVAVAAQLVVKYKNPKYMSAFGQSINSLGNALMGFHCSFVCHFFSDGMRHFSILLYSLFLSLSLVRLTHSLIRVLCRATIYANNGQRNTFVVVVDDSAFDTGAAVAVTILLPFMLSIRSISRSPKYFSLQSSTIAIMPLI